jgi:tetratricopeptide (TPR) repeat protein
MAVEGARPARRSRRAGFCVSAEPHSTIFRSGDPEMTQTEPMQRGQAAIQSRNLPEALNWFERAARENPKDAQALACFGQTLCWLGRRNEGLGRLRESGRLLAKKARKSRDVNLLLGLVEQLQFWSDYPGALELCRQAVDINPGAVRGFQLLALTCSRLNQTKSALAAGRRAAALAPESAMLQILLASLEITDQQYEPARQRLEKALQGQLSPEEKFRAHKELAGVLDRRGEYSRVFSHLHAASELSRLLPEVRRQDAALVPDMIRTGQAEFDRELLGRWAGTEFPEPAPAFLMGFMRSGTTLTQEVLDVHPDVFVADETDLIATVAEELKRIVPAGRTVPERLRRLDFPGVRHLREFYWAKLRQCYGETLGGRRLVDKTTMNTIDLGLINGIFPDAKVVFVLRDPRDVILSCFMQTMIPTPSTVHLLDWRGTAEFYALVMDWWLAARSRLSLGFIEFRYEDAVAEFEPTFRKIFDFLELPWDPAIVQFHERAAGKYVNSPSFSQVAQPLYSSSVGRWRHYAGEYAPVAEMLQPFVEAFGYQE